MPELDPDRLIREAQELREESEDLCVRSRHAIEKSKRLEEIFIETRSTFDRARRKRSLKT